MILDVINVDLHCYLATSQAHALLLSLQEDILKRLSRMIVPILTNWWYLFLYFSSGVFDVGKRNTNTAFFVAACNWCGNYRVWKPFSLIQNNLFIIFWCRCCSCVAPPSGGVPTFGPSALTEMQSCCLIADPIRKWIILMSQMSKSHLL